MGHEVEALVEASSDCEVVERLDVHNNADGEGIDATGLADADVAIDFSTADATVANLPRLAAAGIDTVVGTTGWSAHEPLLRNAVRATGVGVVAAATFRSV